MSVKFPKGFRADIKDNVEWINECDRSMKEERYIHEKKEAFGELFDRILGAMQEAYAKGYKKAMRDSRSLMSSLEKELTNI